LGAVGGLGGLANFTKFLLLPLASGDVGDHGDAADETPALAADGGGRHVAPALLAVLAPEEALPAPGVDLAGDQLADLPGGTRAAPRSPRAARAHRQDARTSPGRESPPPAGR